MPKLIFNLQWKVIITLWPVNCIFPWIPYHLTVPHCSQDQAFYIWWLTSVYYLVYAWLHSSFELAAYNKNQFSYLHLAQRSIQKV